ncbi:MAG: hypothetical protein C0448_12245 [Sphingobacteriaceae bacterium]|nr:hypothetical protein [Sphingobacteriaceae bacterium]
MNRIFISLLLIVITCSCDNNSKPNVGKSTVVTKPKLYFGDSLLTYSFKYATDITYQEELETIENFQIIKTDTKQDTTYIYVYKNFVASLYNGACEIKNDSLYLNIWEDSTDCIAAMVHSKLTYKIKQNKNINLDKLKINFIKTKSPMMKRCE